MPNHCYNQVTITGPGTKDIKEKLKTRKNFAKYGFFEILYPMPEIIKDLPHGSPSMRHENWVCDGRSEDWSDQGVTLDTEYENGMTYRDLFAKYDKAVKECGHVAWYPWALENYGSKWGFYDVSIDSFRKKKIEFSARSAWCPPVAGLKYIAKKYNVHVSIRTTEEFHQFAYIGDFFASGAFSEIETEGILCKGSQALPYLHFESLKDLLYLETDEGSWESLEDYTYSQYLQWTRQ